jgi:RNA polymerase sigma-70 factor, ECF subfamily
MIIDEQRSAGFWSETAAPESVLPDGAGPEEVNAAVDRLLVGDALAQLSADHRAVVRPAYYQGCTTAQIAADLQIAEGTVKCRLHYALRALWLGLGEMGVAR